MPDIVRAGRRWHEIRPGEFAPEVVQVDDVGGVVGGGGGARAVQTLVSADPAAGLAWGDFVVPAGEWWLLQTLQVTLVTDATAGTRRVGYVVDDGVNESFRHFSGFGQGSSATHTYSFVRGGVDNTANRDGTTLGALPAVVIGPGWRVRSNTVGMVAGDNYGSARLSVVTYDYAPEG